MSPSLIQIVIVVVLLILLFGRGKISGLMGDVAKGIKSFKKGIAEEPEPAATEEPKIIEQTSESVVAKEKSDVSEKSE